MFGLTLEDSFCAAHYLEGYHGACAAMHGHTWKVQMTIVADKTRELGLIVDFKDMKRALKGVLARLDHGVVNKVLPEGMNPTAENLAKWIYDQLKPQFAVMKRKKICTLRSVTIWESPTCSCQYNEGKSLLRG